MTTYRSKTGAYTKSNDTKLVNGFVLGVIALVGLLLLGGYWMQQQRSSAVQEYHQATVYENYLYHTEPTSKPAAIAKPVSAPAASSTASPEVRKQLLAHPAVKAGEGFDKPGVQTTGKVIVDAIDQAKGL